MEEVAIKVQGISKAFKLPHEKASSIKSLFISLFKGKRTYERQQVLNDVSFEIKKGEFFGIVGRNGSGKSTLLKLLAGIYSPDKGHIQVNGKLTPFIELGVGFNPELTGRENVFLNGALLGFNRKEMEAMYDEIVEFAELKKFMDQKLKNYSSGMQVRLAFSIAIRANSEILLLDEVLAVGDAAFQRKCLGVFERYKRTNQTVILVTHDMGVVEQYCDKAVLIHDGVLKDIGKPHKIANQYRELNEDAYLESLEKEEIKKEENRRIINEHGLNWDITSHGEHKLSYAPGDEISVSLNWEDERIKNIGVALLKQSGEYVYGTNTIIDKYEVADKKVTYTIKLDIAPGDYIFYFGLFGNEERDALAFVDDGPKIVVKDKTRPKWGGITKLKSDWK